MAQFEPTPLTVFPLHENTVNTFNNVNYCKLMKVEANFCKRVYRHCKHGKPLSTHADYHSTPENPRKLPQSNMVKTHRLLVTTVEMVQIMQREDSFDDGKAILEWFT